jgi:hypothetical protein
VNDNTKQVLVRSHAWGVPEDHKLGRYWCDPIGAAYRMAGDDRCDPRHQAEDTSGAARCKEGQGLHRVSDQQQQQ